MPSTAQPSPETDEKKSRGLGSYVLWAFVAVMVYVLSSGPAMRLNIKFRDERYLTIYKPLVQAGFNVKSPFRKPLLWYWHLWCPGAFIATQTRASVLEA